MPVAYGVQAFPDLANAQAAATGFYDEEYVAAGTIAAGDWVMTDITVSTQGLGRHVIVTAAAVTAPAKTRGVALHAAVSGDKVRVRRSGIVTTANVADAVTAGNALNVGAVAGRAAAATLGAADTHVCGFALTDGSASNTATVDVQCL
jgi:hypothetical protein